jgi:hypothetical protein
MSRSRRPIARRPLQPKSNYIATGADRDSDTPCGAHVQTAGLMRFCDSDHITFSIRWNRCTGFFRLSHCKCDDDILNALHGICHCDCQWDTKKPSEITESSNSLD